MLALIRTKRRRIITLNHTKSCLLKKHFFTSKQNFYVFFDPLGKLCHSLLRIAADVIAQLHSQGILIYLHIVEDCIDILSLFIVYLRESPLRESTQSHYRQQYV